MRKSIMLVHDAFSVKINSFLTSKDKMAMADKEKSAGILDVRRAFLTQSAVGRLFFEAMISYERSPESRFFGGKNFPGGITVSCLKKFLFHFVIVRDGAKIRQNSACVCTEYGVTYTQ